MVGANNAGESTFLRQVNTWLQGGPAALDSMSPRLVDYVAFDRQLSKNDLIHWLSEHAVLIEGAPITGGDYFAIAGTNVHGSAVRQGQFETNHGWLPDLYAPMVFFADATSRLSFPFASQARNEIDEPASTPLQKFQDRRDLFASLSRLSERVFGNPLTLDDFAGATIRVRVGSVDSTPPARDEPLGEFGRAIARLPLLDVQGDGMRSFFGLMIPVLAGAQQIIVVHEPEAFLHPPQARALGRELAVAATARGAQVLVATHDKDFISGVLDAQSDLSIVRLSRDGSTTTRS